MRDIRSASSLASPRPVPGWLASFAAAAAIMLVAAPSALAQRGVPRPWGSVALAAGTVTASDLDGVRPLGSVALRLALPASPLVLRADAATSARADDPSLATAALGVRVLDLETASAYLLAGVGAYSGLHATRSGRNAGGGIELRPALLRGRALFVEGRAHAYVWSDLEGPHTERLTTIVAGLWW